MSWIKYKIIYKPWLLPDRALAFAVVKLAGLNKTKTGSFGWLQAIFYSFRIDRWKRYSSVVSQIKELFYDSPASILDVGGGDGNIKEFLDLKKCQLTVLDINTESLKRIAGSEVSVVAGDGCRLPFKDDAFDIVLSVDSLEHVPDHMKQDYCGELKRVAQKCVILHCPADSADGRFQATFYDERFQEWYRKRFKKDELNTAEHLSAGLPKVEDLALLFPGAELTGRQNAEVWLEYLTREHMPYIRFFSGLYYKLCLKKKDNMPPYHACLITWVKNC